MVAHLGEDGAPTLTAFADDLTAVPAGSSRVVVRHTAATGDISVTLDDQAAFSGVKPTTEASEVVPAKAYQVAVVPPAGGAPLASPQSVEYTDGTANFMYLIGSQADGTLSWAAVKAGDLQTAPAMIQTGDGSTIPSGSDHAPAIYLMLVVAGAAAGGLGFQLRSRRSHASR